MNAAQTEYLSSLTRKTAAALLAKFDHSPYRAWDRSEDAFLAYAKAFEFLNPRSYIQHQRSADGHRFYEIDMS
jgi:hypothetical protein